MSLGARAQAGDVVAFFRALPASIRRELDVLAGRDRVYGERVEEGEEEEGDHGTRGPEEPSRPGGKSPA